MKPLIVLALALLPSTLLAGNFDKQIIEPSQGADDRWEFMLAAPGFMAGIDGDVGIDGIISEVGVGFFDDILPQIDMIWVTRAEASKGRFGVMGELIYLSISDSAASQTVVKKVDVQVDEYLADFSLRWRLVEGKRGFVDALVGVRYTNLYQHMHLQGSSAKIGQASENFVDDVSDSIRDRLNNVLSESDFGNALGQAIRDQISGRLDGPLGPNGDSGEIGIGPLAGSQSSDTAFLIDEIVREEESRLSAEIDALQLQGPAREAAVEERVTDAKKDLEKKIAKVLDENLNRSFSRTDDWWDPYIGVRARYNFTPAIYVTGRGDIGGFGVGSDLMWQAEAALGIQLTRSIFSEIGYRALSFDYENAGLTYNVVTHGAQVTLGVRF